MADKITTSEEYARTGGVCCPVCGEHAIEGGPIEIDAGGAWQNITCTECESTWTDQYNLCGYDMLEVGAHAS